MNSIVQLVTPVKTCMSPTLSVHVFAQVFINGCSAEVVNIPVATRTVDEGPLLAVKY